MIKKILNLFLALMMTVSLLTACLGTKVRDTGGSSRDLSVESTTETTESTEGTTIAAATETAETSRNVETTESMGLTQTVPAEVLKEPVIFDEYELQIGYWNAYFLKNDELAWVFDDNVLDGLLAGEVFTRTDLPVGTVALDLNTVRPDTEIFPGQKLFYLADGRCVFFEQSTTEDREPVYNGRKEENFFGASNWDTDNTPVEGVPVKDYQLLPDTPLPLTTLPQNITVKVDWNMDGKVDTIKREIADASAPSAQTIRYTDGQSGITTDISDRFDGRYLSDNVMLITGGADARPALIDCYDIASSDYEIFIYTYDPVDIVSLTVIHNADFVYEGGEMFIDTSSFLFGNLSGHRTPVQFDGKTLATDPDASEIWWKEALLAKNNGAEHSNYFTYTLTEVAVEKKVSGGSEERVVPAGIAVFPQYYYWDEGNIGGTGYVHFLLTDGTECRMAFEYDTEYQSYWFGNDPQWELFHTSWGG